jgi:phage-related protein
LITSPRYPHSVPLAFAKHMGNAFRTIYAVRLGASLWVIDAFQKKSKSGIKTPQADVARIKERIKRLKETLR